VNTLKINPGSSRNGRKFIRNKPRVDLVKSNSGADNHSMPQARLFIR
jgi:hypothetical protein